MFWKKTAPVRTAANPAMSALAMALEPRMMFDGAAMSTADLLNERNATHSDSKADKHTASGQAARGHPDLKKASANKKPSGASARLLDVIDRKGIEAIA